jgi:hypothetical protein
VFDLVVLHLVVLDPVVLDAALEPGVQASN